MWWPADLYTWTKVFINILTFISGVVGALWAYTKFVIERGSFPGVQFDIELKTVEPHKDKKILEFLLHLKNVGKSALIARNLRLDLLYLLKEEQAELFDRGAGKRGKLVFHHSLRQDLLLQRFDLRLMSSLNDVSDIPTEGKNLIIVAAVNNVLHFRIFDDGKVVVNTDEKRLTEQARQIEDLRKQLESLWPPHELTRCDKGRVITAVTSIVEHWIGGCDLQLMFSVKDVSDIPTKGKNLIIVATVDRKWSTLSTVAIVATVDNVLHFRIFDGDGKVVVDADEKKLREQALQIKKLRKQQIKKLRKQLERLCPPHELTGSERDQVITTVTSIVGHTRIGKETRGIPLIAHDTFVLPGVDQVYTFPTALPQNVAFILAWSSFEYEIKLNSFNSRIFRISRRWGLIQYSLTHIEEPHTREHVFKF